MINQLLSIPIATSVTYSNEVEKIEKSNSEKFSRKGSQLIIRSNLARAIKHLVVRNAVGQSMVGRPSDVR